MPPKDEVGAPEVFICRLIVQCFSGHFSLPLSLPIVLLSFIHLLHVSKGESSQFDSIETTASENSAQASLKPRVRGQCQSSEATYVALITPGTDRKTSPAAVAIKY